MTYLISILCLILTPDCYDTMTSITFKCASSVVTPPIVNNPVFNNVTHIWHLHEAARSTRSDSKGSLTLTENGGTIPNAAGINGNCADFRTSASKWLGSGPFAPFTAPITFAVWVKPTANPVASGAIFGRDDSTGEICLCAQAPDGTGTAYCGTDLDQAAIPLMSLNSWHLIVLAIDSNNGPYNLYFDGVFADGTTMGAVKADGASFVIGKIEFPPTGDALVGYIAEMMIWNGTSITAGNVTTLWNGGSGTFYSP